MKTDRLKITYINPLTKTIETQDINQKPKATKEVRKEIHKYLESKFGEEVLYKISEG